VKPWAAGSVVRLLVLGAMEALIWARYHIVAVAVLAAALAALELLVLVSPHTGQAVRPWGRHRRR
jgi:hypothetical protein